MLVYADDLELTSPAAAFLSSPAFIKTSRLFSKFVTRAKAICKLAAESHARQKADSSDETLQVALGPPGLLKRWLTFQIKTISLDGIARRQLR